MKELLFSILFSLIFLMLTDHVYNTKYPHQIITESCFVMEKTKRDNERFEVVCKDKNRITSRDVDVETYYVAEKSKILTFKNEHYRPIKNENYENFLIYLLISCVVFGVVSVFVFLDSL